MATKTHVTLVDDTDGSDADETVEFGVDGVSFEIDLTTDHAEDLRRALSQFVLHGRRTGGRRHTGGGLHPVTRNTPTNSDGSKLTKEERDRLRMWAAVNDYHVSDRGRIASEVTEAWIAAGKP